MFKLIKALIKLITKLFSTTTVHRAILKNQGPRFKENSKDLNENSSHENIINILEELNNPSTFKDDFKQPCNEAFIHNNRESIIDFNVDPQFNMLTCETNDNNNFDSIKERNGKNSKVIYDSNKRDDNNNNDNSIEQSNNVDINFAIIQKKELTENVKNLQATYQDVFNIYLTIYSQNILKISVMYCWSSTKHTPSMEESNNSHLHRLHIICP